jgi:tetratricopeptide (TPR) repeat protein
MKHAIWLALLLAACVLQAVDADPYGLTAYNMTWSNWNDSLAAKPGDPAALINMAFLNLEQADRLVASLEAQVDSLPPGMVFGVANYRLTRGQPEMALPLYQRLNDKYPKWSCPWRHKGEALLDLRRFDESEAALEQAIAVQANHADAYIMLARVLREQREYKRALKTLEQGLALVAESPEGEVELDAADTGFLHLDLLRKAGKKGDAKALAAKLREKYPDDPFWRESGEK